LKIFVFIPCPSKYHPTAFKVSSVEGQSIIRWNAKYHPLKSIIRRKSFCSSIMVSDFDDIYHSIIRHLLGAEKRL